ncbi:Alpha/Beta hydrolase protein [Podospora australis]|uniref:Alpha/Beta hydrolase protein n=1 Tax=Podospora australis TaxID=1536484 RepID=A0AAN6WZT3_9PEZI|nr:Alpha/Beta hydrolase protein [Podospora australis]
MADPELATRAPESDAAEDNDDLVVSSAPPPAYTPSASTSANPSSPNPAPALCDDCVTDRPTPEGAATKGELTKLNGVDAYISKPPSYPSTPARLLLLLTGGTGLLSVNNQLQADLFAREGYVVVMPDLFSGDPAPNSKATTEVASEIQQEANNSFLDLFKFKAVETAKSFLIDMWLARHTEEKVLPILHKVLEGAKDEFADAQVHGGGVYAVGYCFGGRYVLLLAKEKKKAGGTTSKGGEEDVEANAGKAEEEGEPYIKAGALAHATLVSTEDFVGLKAPVSLVSVESDPLFPDEVRERGEDLMREGGVEHEVQVYPGVPHGFAVVGEYEDSNIKTAQATAYEQMLKWIQDH